MAVVPDGCVDIIWIDGDLAIAGPDVGVHAVTLAPGTTVIGARFRPGVARRWLGISMAEIVGGRVSLREFWGASAHAIAQRIGDAPTTTDRIRVFEAALDRVAKAHEPAASDMGFVFNALKTRSAGPGMSAILDQLAISPRTLRRRCEDAFGYGPKTLDRILRFQRFLARVKRGPSTTLAALAVDAGYADQAHLTREVLRLSSLTPATILSQVRA